MTDTYRARPVGPTFSDLRIKYDLPDKISGVYLGTGGRFSVRFGSRGTWQLRFPIIDGDSVSVLDFSDDFLNVQDIKFLNDGYLVHGLQKGARKNRFFVTDSGGRIRNELRIGIPALCACTQDENGNLWVAYRIEDRLGDVHVPQGLACYTLDGERIDTPFAANFMECDFVSANGSTLLIGTADGHAVLYTEGGEKRSVRVAHRAQDCAAFDPATGKTVAFSHPRKEKEGVHFRFGAAGGVPQFIRLTDGKKPIDAAHADARGNTVLLSDTERCWLYEINPKQCEMHLRGSRDELARYFLPEEREIRIKTVSYARQQEMACALLGCDTPEWRLGSRGKKPPEEDPSFYLHYKESDYLGKYKSYSLYFSLCRLLGVRHVYDIGCEAINQSFLLLDDSELSYTGMGPAFDLNDWREDDIENKKCTRPFVRKAPPPLCDGRIRFVKGLYPDTAFDVQPNHIAIASYSLTMCMGKEAIDKATAALTRDFERILFNPPFFRSEDHECWIQADWSGFTIRHFGYYGYLFATKIPEDLQKIKEMYPIDDDGVIGAGLADIGFKILPNMFLTDWVRD